MKKQPNRQILFLGMTTGRRHDWQRYLAEPVATRSSKPDSVAKEIAEKKEKQEAQSQYWPLTATVNSCVILNQDGEEVFVGNSGFSTAEGEVSHTALLTIGGMYAGSDDVSKLNIQPTMYDLGFSLYGLNVRDRMRVLAIDALRFANQSVEGAVPSMVPVGLWYYRAFETAPWCDPYEAVVPSELRNDITWDSLAEFLGITVQPGVNLDSDAHMQAEMARQITLRAGLYIKA